MRSNQEEHMKDPYSLGHGGKHSNYGPRGIEKRLTALNSLFPVRGNRLLDLGCADGTYTLELAKGFERVDAIDVEPERLADFVERLGENYSKCNIAIQQASGDDLPFASNTFNMVTAIEVMEHVGDLDAVLAEIHRVLVPGGRFMMTSPNRWFPFETHGPLINGRRMHSWQVPGLPWIPPLHNRWSNARVFTAKSLNKRAIKQGLMLVNYTYIMPPFDRKKLGKAIRPVTDRIENSPFKFFGMAIVAEFVCL